ncbi:MAG TPA: glycosyltransferase [Candidatus Acidoferrales bacterium]|nr:glycosyltransferase [Candidatus Acidoferrales bacterium]
MIRVLFVEASSGGVVGGSLTGLYHLIRGLDRTRFAPAMVLYEQKNIESDLREIGVPVHHVRRRRVPKEHALLKYEGYHRAKASTGVGSTLRLGRHAVRLAVEELPAATRLARIIRRSRADVVHLGNGVRANFDGILACVLTRTPCVCHVKGFEKYSGRERWAASRVDALVCMTKAVEQHCRACGVSGRTTQVIYDALDEAAFLPRRDAAAVRAELGITNGSPCLGVVGNIQEWKGQVVLVEAMARVAQAVPHARGLIIGGVHRAGAAYHDQLQARLRALHLDERLCVTGFRRDIADVINALDVVVHTSVRAEPFGRVILEGMLLGKPVVASAAGGVPELIHDGETGFLTPPGDAAALAERLIPLLQDAALRRDVGQRAQAWAREQFSLTRHVAALSSIYATLTKGH